MTKREEIRRQIDDKQSQIEKLQSEIIDLQRMDLTLSDDKRQFIEQWEEVVISKSKSRR